MPQSAVHDPRTVSPVMIGVSFPGTKVSEGHGRDFLVAFAKRIRGSTLRRFLGV